MSAPESTKAKKIFLKLDPILRVTIVYHFCDTIFVIVSMKFSSFSGSVGIFSEVEGVF